MIQPNQEEEFFHLLCIRRGGHGGAALWKDWSVYGEGEKKGIANSENRLAWERNWWKRKNAQRGLKEGNLREKPEMVSMASFGVPGRRRGAAKTLGVILPYFNRKKREVKDFQNHSQRAAMQGDRGRRSIIGARESCK